MLNIEKLKEELRKEGIESEQITIVKNNVECKAIRVITANHPSISPVIYYSSEDTLESFLFKIHAVLELGDPQIDLKNLTDWKYVKEHITLGIQRKSANVSLVKKELLNLELYLKITLNLKNTNNVGTCKLNRNLQEQLKVTEKGLWEAAYENTFKSYSIRNMYEMCGVENTDDCMMYVVTSSLQNAATALCFPELFKKFCNEKGEDGCYILPSSIEELILLPRSAVTNAGMCASSLANMVQSVNAEAVEPEIQLDAVAYYYSTESNDIQIVAEYENGQ